MPQKSVDQLIAEYNAEHGNVSQNSAQTSAQSSNQSSSVHPSVDELINSYNQEHQAVNTPQQYQQSTQQPQQPEGNALWNHVTSIARGVAQPAVDLAEGTQNLVSRGLGALTGKSPETYGTYHDNLLAGAANPTEAMLASIPASFALPGGALLKGAKGVNALARGAGLGAAYGGVMGATKDNSNILSDMAMGAAIPTALSGLIKGVPAGIKGAVNAGKTALAKSTLNKLEEASQRPYSSVATPQQAANKLAMTGDAPIDLGSLVNDVGLSQKYKKMSNLWGSNNPQRMEAVVGKTDQIADNLADQMWQGHDENTGTQAVLNHIKNNAELHKNVANKMYGQVESEAANRGVLTNERPNSQEIAKQLLTDHANTENLGGYSWLSNSPYKKLVENISKGVSPAKVDSQGNPLKTDADFSDLQNLKSFVGKEIGKQQKLGADVRDNDAISNLGKLYGGLNEDMGHALEQQHPDLHGLWKDATKYYKDNVVPYNKNKVVNDLVNSDSAQNLFNALNKNHPQIQKVVEHMQPTYKKLLLGLGMKNAVIQDVTENNKVSGNASKLVSAYAKLNNSPILKTALDSNDHDLFQKLTVMNEMAKPYRPLLRNPETGAKNTGLLAHGAQGLGVLGSALGAHALGIGALPAAAAGLVGTGALIKGGNALTDLMANPKILEAYSNPGQRNSLIKEAISSGKTQLGTTANTKSNTTAGGLLKALSKGASGTASKIPDPRLINYLLNIGN